MWRVNHGSDLPERRILGATDLQQSGRLVQTPSQLNPASAKRKRHPRALTLPKVGRIDPQRPQVHISLTAMMDLIIDSILNRPNIRVLQIGRASCRERV